MYQSVWKCRLCGQRFVGGGRYDENETDAVIINFEKHGGYWTMHECYGGSKGIADLQGFERIRDDMS